MKTTNSEPSASGFRPKKPTAARRIRRKTIVAAVLAAIIIFLVWLKFADNSKLKSLILRTVPVPILILEGQSVYSTQFYERLKEAKGFYAQEHFDESLARGEILNRLAYEARLRALARKQNAELAQWEEFSDFGPQPPGELLKNAARSQGEEAAFRFWFYSNRKFMPETYARADFILEALKAGKAFGQLAEIYSQDSQSLQFQGDLGPIPESNLLFELRRPLALAKVGETLTLPSRLGVHIIQIYLRTTSPAGDNVLYLRQILLNSPGFQTWVASETKNYKTTNLINVK